MQDQKLKNISRNLDAVRERISEYEHKYNRKPSSVKLLAVTKDRSVAEVQAAAKCGQVDFGENYLQEALEKIDATQEFNLNWHFIGHIQSKKCKLIAEKFSWVHSVDRLKIAEALNEFRPGNMSLLDIFLEVNLDDEPQKSGVAPSELFLLCNVIAGMKRLRLRGLMAVPEPTEDFASQHEKFKRLAKLQLQLVAHGIPLDNLSIGMSQDFEAAIASGATIVRIGSAIFGEREEKPATKLVHENIIQLILRKMQRLTGQQFSAEEIKNLEDFCKHNDPEELLAAVEKAEKNMARTFTGYEHKEFSRDYFDELNEQFREAFVMVNLDQEEKIKAVKNISKENTVVAQQIIEEAEGKLEIMLKDDERKAATKHYLRNCRPGISAVEKANIALLGVMIVGVTGAVMPIVRQNWGNMLGAPDRNPYAGMSAIDQGSTINFTFGDSEGMEARAIINAMQEGDVNPAVMNFLAENPNAMSKRQRSPTLERVY